MPLNLLTDNARWVNLDSNMMLDGIEPIKPLLFNDSVTRKVIWLNVVGNAPSSRLKLRKRPFNAVHEPNAVGIVPLNSFLDNAK